MNIPILLNHDTAKVIGTWREDGIVEFDPNQKITREQVFDIFGNVGFTTLVCVVENSVAYIKAIKVCEFSLGSAHVRSEMYTALKTLHKEILVRHNGRMPDEVARAMDAAATALKNHEG